MSRLVFAAADVRRVVEHSLAAPAQSEQAVDFVDGKTITRPPEAPAVIFVHDQGVYLMSNGKPRDLIKARSHNGKHVVDTSFVAYAAGCDPAKDLNWYDVARGLVGGDDFGEVLPWASEIKQALDAGAKWVIIEMKANQIALKFKSGKHNGRTL